MYARARASFDACVEQAADWDGFMAALERKHMVLAPWCDEEEAEEEIKKRSATKDAMGAKSLCIPLEQVRRWEAAGGAAGAAAWVAPPPLPEGTPCFVTGKPAKNWVLLGRSY
ncbi:hypothetical protein CHLNCDRAFT_143908 [Chlorella variabilis]|uniref:Proline-tRNA ligase class II C-terminal domain-containing protein n=1 Tax=Chlorella variabilis TaxID=554065 RepID=E1ZAQ2_CHLVA|nr:hypothetical protein CHLNCDRAFT_143908 [Chlorella variabilis]EFN57301.1 hypothetical protein CHLNCDRAFT_143908 [Chlorella variabilis]|eukprot:XP_005849403.1 hypothetical protein CHLNCDRAFT_143908 [Chlorella variabilis]